MAGLAEGLVRLASTIVPSDVRSDWKREWHAELAWSRRRGSAEWRLALRAAGAMAHACWLLWDRWRWDVIWQDIRYAARTLARRPGYAVVAVLSLAIGIGANAAMFSAVRAVLLRPLPFSDPDALVSIATTTLDRPDAMAGSTAPPDFVDWRRDVDAFAEMAAFVEGASALTGDGPAEQVPSANVTGGFFAVLGVAPLHGRVILTEDDPATTPDVAVLGHGLWKRRFGGHPDVVGTTITVDGKPTLVAGVMPESFAYPLGSELWLPLRFTDRELETQRGAQYLDVLARLAPGTSIEEAEREMRTYARHLADLYPRNNKERTVKLHPMRDALVGDVRPALLLLLGAVGFVLLIVCVNVANLALTRALGRQRELAVRTALGASRGRLVRGLLTESVLLAGAGGVAGLLLGAWAARAMASIDDGIGIPLLDESRVDAAVTVFTAGVSVLAALLFGTLPAWRASKPLDVAQRIREDSHTTTGDRHRQRLGDGLIVAETALAVALLVGAGLLVRSFLGLAAVDLGIDPSGVQTFNLSLPDTAYPTPVARAAFMETLMARVAAHPQVEAVGAIFGLPLSRFGYSISTSTVDGRQLDQDEQMRNLMQVRVVTPHYFRVMGILLKAGRALIASDHASAVAAVVVNEAAAERLWPGASPLGHELTLGTRLGQGGRSAGGTVVGVVGNVRDGGPAAPARPTVYLAHAQFPMDFFSVTAKARGEPGALVEPIRAIVASLDPQLPMFRVRTMEQLAGDAVARPRLFLTLLGLFAAAAVLLAAVGIYGVLAQRVSQRTREIGLRLALGAERERVMRMVIGQAMSLAMVGLVLGFGLALGAGRLMRGLLFGVQPMDLPTYAAVGLGFALVALVASLVPALRAARVDPMIALRSE
jgi:predicted permease